MRQWDPAYRCTGNPIVLIIGGKQDIIVKRKKHLENMVANI